MGVADSSVARLVREEHAQSGEDRRARREAGGSLKGGAGSETVTQNLVFVLLGGLGVVQERSVAGTIL